MIFLICGTPGSAKTLWTLIEVERRRECEQRTVYQSGIDGLTLDWRNLDDPATWHQVPDNSIVVIDECQRVFPVRRQASKVPEHVEAFETHRHRGIDVYLITQDPKFIDVHVRKLVGDYRYLDRPFNQNYSVIWRFRHVCDWKSTLERSGAEKSRWPHNKEAYNWYKSAETHTHKKRLPRFLLWVPVAVGVLLWSLSGLVNLGSKIKNDEQQPDKVESILPVKLSTMSMTAPAYANVVPGSPGLIQQNPILSTAEYLAARVPRLPELPYSAPVYDELAKPVTFPKVSACVQSKNDCQCWSQQATRLMVDKRFCIFFVENGYFDPFLAPPSHSPALKASASDSSPQTAQKAQIQSSEPVGAPAGA